MNWVRKGREKERQATSIISWRKVLLRNAENENDSTTFAKELRAPTRSSERTQPDALSGDF
jgi:hypothetical protein